MAIIHAGGGVQTYIGIGAEIKQSGEARLRIASVAECPCVPPEHHKSLRLASDREWTSERIVRAFDGCSISSPRMSRLFMRLVKGKRIPPHCHRAGALFEPLPAFPLNQSHDSTCTQRTGDGYAPISIGLARVFVPTEGGSGCRRMPETR